MMDEEQQARIVAHISCDCDPQKVWVGATWGRNEDRFPGYAIQAGRHIEGNFTSSEVGLYGLPRKVIEDLIARAQAALRKEDEELTAQAADLEQDAARGMEREHVEDDEAARDLPPGHRRMILHGDGSVAEMWRGDEEEAAREDELG